MIVLGISGLENSIPFKRSRWPGLDEREYRISQGHDSAAALVRDGAIVAAAAEERFSRRKHTGEFPERAIAYCLEAAGVELDDVDEIAHGFDYTPYRPMYMTDPFTAEQYEEVFSRDSLLGGCTEPSRISRPIGCTGRITTSLTPPVPITHPDGTIAWSSWSTEWERPTARAFTTLPTTSWICSSGSAPTTPSASSTP